MVYVTPTYKKINGITQRVYPITRDVAVELSDGRRLTDLVHDIDTVSQSLEATNKKLEELLAGGGGVSPIADLSVTPSIAEMGSTVSSLILRWSYNRDIVKQTLNGEVIDVSLREKRITEPIRTTTIFKLIGYLESGQVSKSSTLEFCNGIYYGKSSSTIYDDDLVKSLTKKLSNSKSRNLTVNAGKGEYIYYCLPSRLGEPTFVVGGFEGGFDRVAVIDFTNNSNFTEPYYIYRSAHPNLGNTEITVK